VFGARRLLGGGCSAEVEVRSADGEARHLLPEELVSIELAALKARCLGTVVVDAVLVDAGRCCHFEPSFAAIS
jgi:hypothetical protein